MVVVVVAGISLVVDVVVGVVTSPLLLVVPAVAVAESFAELAPVSFAPAVPTSFEYGIRCLERARCDRELLPVVELAEPVVPALRSTSPDDVLLLVPFSELPLPFLGQFVVLFALVMLPLLVDRVEPEPLLAVLLAGAPYVPVDEPVPLAPAVPFVLVPLVP